MLHETPQTLLYDISIAEGALNLRSLVFHSY